MPAYLDQIAKEWFDRADALAQWTLDHLVNRTDVWVKFTAAKRQTGYGTRSGAFTAPMPDERGEVFLEKSSLLKHFQVRTASSIIGLHSTSPENTSRWLAVDIDLHDPEDLSVTPETNFAAAKAWHEKLLGQGFDPLLLDSNGQGGFHLWLVFAEPIETAAVHAFGEQLIANYADLGLDEAPEIKPGKPSSDHYGNSLRLFGRHPNREHYTRVWNDEPWAEQPWLEGHDALDRILRTRLAPVELAKQHRIA